jgi:hypothetical protein
MFNQLKIVMIEAYMIAQVEEGEFSPTRMPHGQIRPPRRGHEYLLGQRSADIKRDEHEAKAL